jgi:hypothetical protein
VPRAEVGDRVMVRRDRGPDGWDEIPGQLVHIGPWYLWRRYWVQRDRSPWLGRPLRRSEFRVIKQEE